MKEKVKIIKIECFEENCFVTLKLIRNGNVEIFNSVPIQNVNKIVKNFSLI